jgi:hypothetical protein
MKDEASLAAQGKPRLGGYGNWAPGLMTQGFRAMKRGGASQFEGDLEPPRFESA